jgi:hypothetical protein
MKKIYLAALLLIIATFGYGQKQDTVIIPLAKTSKIVFTMEDPGDIEILKFYDFQRLFENILQRLEDKNKPLTSSDSSSYAADEKSVEEDESYEDRNEDDESSAEDDSGDSREWKKYKRRWNHTQQSFNFDLGMNNYLRDNKFPSDSDPYAVRPWGSWYFGFSSVQRSRLARNFFLEWGLGASWYSFKFQKDNTLITKDDDGVSFAEDPRDFNFKKSKLSVSYIQASLIPVIDFNDRSHKHRFWDGDRDSFRIGIGPYVGYRITSHSKQVYNDNGREREKDRDSFYLNNLRYGARLQIGYRSTDLFFNYDMNDLFAEGKGPQLNAFSFGVIF